MTKKQMKLKENTTICCPQNGLFFYAFIKNLNGISAMSQAMFLANSTSPGNK